MRSQNVTFMKKNNIVALKSCTQLSWKMFLKQIAGWKY